MKSRRKLAASQVFREDRTKTSKLQNRLLLIKRTEDGAKNGVTFANTSKTEPLVTLRYFGPEVNPDAPEMPRIGRTSFDGSG